MNLSSHPRLLAARTALRRTKTYGYLCRLGNLLRDPEYRAEDAVNSADFERFCRENGGFALKQKFLPRDGKPKLALMVRNISLPFAKIEAVVMKALQMAGFETVVLGNRQFGYLRYEWLAGNKSGFTLDDFDSGADSAWIEREFPRLLRLEDWLGLTYQGVNVGRFVLATALRNLKVGQLEFQDPEVRKQLRWLLEVSIWNTRAGDRLLQATRPDCVVFLDRGYSGQGEIFDLAMNRGIEALTWNVGYKSNLLVFKRYSASNRRDHPLEPSADTWQRVQAMPWKAEYAEAVRKEVLQCYETQDWFSVVGTQFGKAILSRQKTLDQLNLSPDRKVGVIFPHILWDGSFFFGEDLFDNYAEWLIETLKAACANDRMQWVVKVHPGHVVKARMEKLQSKASEVELIDRLFANLPDHVKLVYPETNLSTYSLFEIADYTITVRGTVGIESGLFGIPVVTAGSGRYARRGFTLDSSTREEYLQLLATLETRPRLNAKQQELAERYAFAIFLCRPLKLTTMSLAFERDRVATPKLVLHNRTRDDWLEASDMRRLAAWIADGRQEDMLQLPGDA